MRLDLRALSRNLIPDRMLRQVRQVRGNDPEITLEHKRQFFWSVFKALDFNGISGDYVEFGSHGATTFRLAWDQVNRRRTYRHLWAFDSFAGLPAPANDLDNHPNWVEGRLTTELGEFDRICRKHGMPPDSYSVVPGFYEDTLPSISTDDAPSDIALAYIDCDLYSSTVAVLDFLRPRLKHGMIVAFDDYFCWSPTQISGERRAHVETDSANPDWNMHRYRDIGWAGTSFVVERASLLRET